MHCANRLSGNIGYTSAAAARACAAAAAPGRTPHTFVCLRLHLHEHRSARSLHTSALMSEPWARPDVGNIKSVLGAASHARRHLIRP
jgi:hypothetical protein